MTNDEWRNLQPGDKVWYPGVETPWKVCVYGETKSVGTIVNMHEEYHWPRKYCHPAIIIVIIHDGFFCELRTMDDLVPNPTTLAKTLHYLSVTPPIPRT